MTRAPPVGSSTPISKHTSKYPAVKNGMFISVHKATITTSIPSFISYINPFAVVSLVVGNGHHCFFHFTVTEPCFWRGHVSFKQASPSIKLQVSSQPLQESLISYRNLPVNGQSYIFSIIFSIVSSSVSCLES